MTKSMNTLKAWLTMMNSCASKHVPSMLWSQYARRGRHCPAHARKIPVPQAAIRQFRPKVTFWKFGVAKSRR